MLIEIPFTRDFPHYENMRTGANLAQTEPSSCAKYESYGSRSTFYAVNAPTIVSIRPRLLEVASEPWSPRLPLARLTSHSLEANPQASRRSPRSTWMVAVLRADHRDDAPPAVRTAAALPPRADVSSGGIIPSSTTSPCDIFVGRVVRAWKGERLVPPFSNMGGLQSVSKPSRPSSSGAPAWTS